MFSFINRKKILKEESEESKSKRTLVWYDLAAYGIAATVGSGIFFSCGEVAQTAGPSVIFSIIIAGILSILTGICYLEFASSIPVSGSGYAYFYTLVGEFPAWFIGWNMTLEYSFAAAATASDWSMKIGQILGIKRAYDWTFSDNSLIAFLNDHSIIGRDELRLNMLGCILVIICGYIVNRGLKFGSRITNVITTINLSIISFIIAVGLYAMFFSKNAPAFSNLTPFFPTKNPVSTILGGSGTMFFSFIGYDTISSLANEAINPSRDLPIAVFITIGVAITLYCLIAFILTGLQGSLILDSSIKIKHLDAIFSDYGMGWMSNIVIGGSILCYTASIFSIIMGQPKIFQSMAEDGLMPFFFAKNNRRTNVPTGSLILTVAITAVIVLFFKANKGGMMDMISFGTLIAMSMLCVALVDVRIRKIKDRKQYYLGLLSILVFFFSSFFITFFEDTGFYVFITMALVLPALVCSAIFIINHDTVTPNANDVAFICPLMPLFPLIAILANNQVIARMEEHRTKMIIQFSIWTMIGAVMYFSYGISNSLLAKKEESRPLLLKAVWEDK